MEHNSLEQMLPDFARGRLNGSDAEAVKEHLMTCATCQSRLIAMESLMQDLDQWRPTVPDGYFQTILPRFRAHLDKKRTGADEIGFSWLRFLAPVGAAVVAVGLLTSLPLESPSTKDENGLRDLAGEFNAGEFADIVLEEVQGALSGPQQQEAIAQAVPENTAARQLLEHIAGEDGLEELAPLQAVDDLENEELDAILGRLEQRKFL